MKGLSFLRSLNAQEVKELQAYIDNQITEKFQEITSKELKNSLPICSACGTEMTTIVYGSEDIRRICSKCESSIQIGKYSKQTPEPKEPLPKCQECKTQPATIIIFSERVKGGAKVCGGCVHLSKYSGR